MKIAFLTFHFPPVWLAGIELVTYNLASELVKRGHEVHVITTLDDGLPKESKEDGFTVHRIPYKTQVPLVSLSSFFLKVRWKVKEIRPDVLHIQNILWGWMGASMYRSFSIPYIVNAHGDDIYQEHRFKGPAIRNGVKRAGAVVALTQAMKRRIEEVCGAEVWIVPNGVCVERFENPQGKREAIGIPRDAKVMTFAGGLRPVKGVQYLIQAMPLIAEKHGDAFCLVIGDGQERNRLEEMTKDLHLESKVKFLGKVENDRVPDLLSLSDIFVLPSLSEGFPLVLLEAMAAGLPLVCSKVGGTPDLVVEGQNGFLVEPRNPSQLAEKLTFLLDSDQVRSQIGARNREEAREYGWDRVAQKFEEIYSGLQKPAAKTESGAAMGVSLR